MYLLAYKIDLYENMGVDGNEVKKYCEENNLRYFEISCLNTSGIKEFLDDLINELIKK